MLHSKLQAQPAPRGLHPCSPWPRRLTSRTGGPGARHATRRRATPRPGARPSLKLRQAPGPQGPGPAARRGRGAGRRGGGGRGARVGGARRGGGERGEGRGVRERGWGRGAGGAGRGGPGAGREAEGGRRRRLPPRCCAPGCSLSLPLPLSFPHACPNFCLCLLSQHCLLVLAKLRQDSLMPFLGLCSCLYGLMGLSIFVLMHTVSSFGICQGMSWQHLHQPCVAGLVEHSSLSLSLPPSPSLLLPGARGSLWCLRMPHRDMCVTMSLSLCSSRSLPVTLGMCQGMSW